MLARIQTFFTRGYQPLPNRPVDTRAPEPPIRSETLVAGGFVEALACWSEVIERGNDGDPVLDRLDVAESLSVALDAFRACRSSPDGQLEEAIGRLLGSPHLLRAVTAAARSVAVEYVELAADIQVAYLVGLSIAVSNHCLSSDRVLDLLLGRAGKACTDSIVRPPSYAHHLHSLSTVSKQNAFIFAKIMILMILKSERNGSAGLRSTDVCQRLLLQKGYGPTGSNNFYSAIALGPPSPGHECLLGMLAEFDLLPSLAQLARKEGVRGRALEQVLGAARDLAHSKRLIQTEPLSPWEPVDWMRGQLQMLLCPERIQGLRSQHQDRLALASAYTWANARRQESALLSARRGNPAGR